MRKSSSEEFPRKLVLDTSVLVEYIVDRAPNRKKIARILEMGESGELELYVSPVTISELIYVSSRIYELASVSKPNESALEYAMWLTERVSIAEIDFDIAIRAGELRKLLRIALPDCYVIALAERLDAKPLFSKVEREMKPVLENLRKFGTLFLDEITL